MEFILIVALVSLLIGLSKGGMGAALVASVLPLLSQVMPPADAQSIALPLLIIGDLIALRLYWKQWDMGYIRRMIPVAIPPIIVGTYLLVTLPSPTLRHIVGIFTLIFVVYKLAEERLHTLKYEPRGWHAYAAGAISGLGSALANVGAPPFMAYLLLQDLPTQIFIGTTTLYFFIINVLKVPPLVYSGTLNLNRLLSVVWALPIIPLGVWLGRWMVQRLDKRAFERVMLVVLVFTSFILLFVEPR
jgi:uncharacterized protein